MGHKLQSHILDYHTQYSTTYNTFLEYAADLVVVAWYFNNLSMQ